MTKFKLIIAGSRSIEDYSIVREAVVKSGLWKEHRNNLEIVSGTAEGVDRLGEIFALNNGLIIHPFKPDWDRFGKRAGMLRNCEMGDFADGLVAVWDGRSRGTQHMIRYMTGLGKFVYVYNLMEE